MILFVAILRLNAPKTPQRINETEQFNTLDNIFFWK